MTTWVEDPSGGRARGPVAIARAWVEVLIRPGRFFQTGVSPGDQAPGLVFAMLVVLGAEGSRLLLVEGATPDVAGGGIAGSVLYLGAVILLVTPAALHLLGAITTVLLRVLAPDRGNVSETIQVLAYSTAPCLLAGHPSPHLRAVCGFYGAWLLLVGMHTIHGVSGKRNLLVSVVPAAVVFGYGFRAFGAVGTILRQWYII